MLIHGLKKPLFWKVSCILLVLFFPILFVAIQIFMSAQCQEAYDSIQRGDTEQQVIAVMGKPWKIEFGVGQSLVWDTEPTLINPVVTCTKIYWYGIYILAQQWTIGFDQNGRALTKYHYSSPWQYQLISLGPDGNLGRRTISQTSKQNNFGMIAFYTSYWSAAWLKQGMSLSRNTVLFLDEMPAFPAVLHNPAIWRQFESTWIYLSLAIP